MSAQIIPFDFEEQAVRVLMRDGDPWFVAVDVCRVLDIGNSRDAVARLDDDERSDVGITDASGTQTRKTNIISESGLYALIFTSRKPEAKRFRKWVTAEVLPSLRRTGRFDMQDADTGAAQDGADDGDASFAGLTPREGELWLSAVREARLLRGPKAAVELWKRSPLPPLSAADHAADAAWITEAEARACRDHLMAADLQGRKVIDLIRTAAAQEGTRFGEWTLDRNGLRWTGHALFIANSSPFVFRAYRHTRWQNGAHRAALLALPGASIPLHPRTFGGKSHRGIIVPVDLGTGPANVEGAA